MKSRRSHDLFISNCIWIPSPSLSRAAPRRMERAGMSAPWQRQPPRRTTTAEPVTVRLAGRELRLDVTIDHHHAAADRHRRRRASG